MSHSVCGQVRLEAGTYTAGVAVWAGHLAPDGAQLGLLATGTTGDGGPLLSAVYIYASLASVEDSVVTVARTLNLEI